MLLVLLNQTLKNKNEGLLLLWWQSASLAILKWTRTKTEADDAL